MLQPVRFVFLFFALLWNALPSQADPNMKVETSFETIRLWLQTNAAPLYDEFNPPASAEEIHAFESQAGVTLPRSLRAAYSIYNGEKGTTNGIFGAWRWLPLNEAMSHRQYLLESGLSLAAGAIPVLISGGGDYFYAESVESARNDSEIMEWWHEQPGRDVKYKSFAAFLAEFAELLERGQYVYLPDEFVGLIDRDDL